MELAFLDRSISGWGRKAKKNIRDLFAEAGDGIASRKEKIENALHHLAQQMNALTSHDPAHSRAMKDWWNREVNFFLKLLAEAWTFSHWNFCFLNIFKLLILDLICG